MIATFAAAPDAEALVTALRDVFGIASASVQTGIAAAYQEAYHDHPLVAAWVPDAMESEIRAFVRRQHGTLHESSAREAELSPEVTGRRRDDVGEEEPPPRSGETR